MWRDTPTRNWVAPQFERIDFLVTFESSSLFLKYEEKIVVVLQALIISKSNPFYEIARWVRCPRCTAILNFGCIISVDEIMIHKNDIQWYLKNCDRQVSICTTAIVLKRAMILSIITSIKGLYCSLEAKQSSSRWPFLIVIGFPLAHANSDAGPNKIVHYFTSAWIIF